MNKMSPFSFASKKQTLLKFITITASLLLIISLLAALTFESCHANHEEHCHEEDCPICLLLQVIHNNCKIFADANVASVEFLSIFYINTLILSAVFFAPNTLVSQKIKLVI